MGLIYQEWTRITDIFLLTELEKDFFLFSTKSFDFAARGFELFLRIIFIETILKRKSLC